MTVIKAQTIEEVDALADVDACAAQFVVAMRDMLPQERPGRDSLKKIKEAAWSNALSTYPSMIVPYRAFMDAAHNGGGVGRVTSDPDVMIGRRLIFTAGGKMSWAYRNKYGPLSDDEDERVTMRSKMLEWVQENDHVPNPIALSHFCGGTTSGWRSSISHAQANGYTIESDSPGFVVMARPEPAYDESADMKRLEELQQELTEIYQRFKDK